MKKHTDYRRCILCDQVNNHTFKADVAPGGKFMCKMCGDVMLPRHIPPIQQDKYYELRYKDPRNVLQDRKTIQKIFTSIEEYKWEDKPNKVVL